MVKCETVMRNTSKSSRWQLWNRSDCCFTSFLSSINLFNSLALDGYRADIAEMKSKLQSLHDRYQDSEREREAGIRLLDDAQRKLRLLKNSIYDEIFKMRGILQPTPNQISRTQFSKVNWILSATCTFGVSKEFIKIKLNCRITSLTL